MNIPWPRKKPPAPKPAIDATDTHRKTLGRAGEQAAAAELRRHGYRIIHQNYQVRSGEIDIIAEHNNHIVFIEVKTRSPRAWATPESAITPEKIARITRAGRRYLASYLEPSPIRIDTVAILTDHDGAITSIRIHQDVSPYPSPAPYRKPGDGPI